MLGELAKANGLLHLALLSDNPYRVTYLPGDFSQPLPTIFQEETAGGSARITIGFTSGLLRDLSTVADCLDIPLSDSGLTDDVAQRINDFEPLSAGEDSSPTEALMPSWLTLYEGARVAVEHNVALALAG